MHNTNSVPVEAPAAADQLLKVRSSLFAKLQNDHALGYSTKQRKIIRHNCIKVFVLEANLLSDVMLQRILKLGKLENEPPYRAIKPVVCREFSHCLLMMLRHLILYP